ncbi:uncharacterized protein LOC129572752 [Sitodiplosis mosellana]|uniref:uncharacterized protein LOC129572752 n=1 Tax=Sitodiplosis mosellana TaxID=263140 RepID=UPI002443FD7F|nr:uncharacterized protein LOC129572752 [Sitodiplosis mosellana]
MKKFNNFGVFSTIFILILSSEQIFGTIYYEINDNYPIAVESVHASNYRTGGKRSAQNYDDAEHTGLKLVQPPKDEHDTEIPQVTSALKKPRHARTNRFCVRCPKPIQAVSREGLDGVLVQPPPPRSCKTHLPFSEHLFKIETLFGPDIPFVLPKGRHSLHAKIRNVETGLVIRSCVLKYDVIVPHCNGYPNLKNKNLTMSCTAATVWGSKCAFGCKNEGEFLTHREPMVCSESLEWIGEEPNCTQELNNEVYLGDEPANDTKSGEYCTQPEPPTNGRFICVAANQDFQALLTNVDVNLIETQRTLAPGSTCHVQCNRSFAIPYHLNPFSKVECTNGTWNTTNIDFCYKRQPQRRHLKYHRKETHT